MPHLESDLTVSNENHSLLQSPEEPASNDTDDKSALSVNDSKDCALLPDNDVDEVDVASVSKRSDDVDDSNALTDDDMEEVESSIALNDAEQPKIKTRTLRRTVEERKIS